VQSPSAAWLALARSTSWSPIYLVELLGLNTFIATGPVPSNPVWLLGQGLVFGSGWTFGGTQPIPDRRLAQLDAGGIGQITYELSESEGVRIGNTSVRLLNQDVFTSLLATRTLDGQPVRISLGFEGLGYQDFLPLFYGAIDQYSYGWEGLDLSIVDRSFKLHVDLSTIIGAQYFPGTPAANRGKAIPILLGRGTNIEAIQIVGDAQGTVAFGLDAIITHVDLPEIDAAFPPTGTISIGSETSVTYTRRLHVNFQGQTYLRLEGLTRGSPTTHAVGEAVTLTNVSYQYLLGYALGAVGDVREDGALLSPASYTYTPAAAGADRPVSTLTFTSQQGLITFDAEGINIRPEQLISNGGFEVGNASSWTLDGATVLVDTAYPYAGTYSAKVTGASGTYRSIYQDFPVVANKRYHFQFAYADTVIDPSPLITNGSFENGPNNPNHGAPSWTRYLRSGFLGTPVVLPLGNNQFFQGNWALEIRPNVFFDTSGQGHGFTGSLYNDAVYQDVATTIGVEYEVAYTGQRTLASLSTIYGVLGAEASTYLEVGVLADVTYYSRGNPTLNEALLATDGQTQYFRTTLRFTADTTITRVAVGGRGHSFFNNGASLTVPSVRLDDVSMIQTSLIQRTDSAYELGTPDDPDLYSSKLLSRRTQFGFVEDAFTAVGNLARFTFKTRYLAAASHSYLDAVATAAEGRNPIEAIRDIWDTFLSHIPRDEASFNLAQTQLNGWQFAAYLPAPGASLALLQRMARQCRCRLFEGPGGVYKILYQDDLRTPVMEFTATGIQENSLTITREPIDNVYTDYYLYYGKKTNTSGQSREDFQAVAYATPEETTHPSQGHSALCAGALAVYGRRRRFELFADMIRDVDTAHKLLSFFVNRHTRRRYDLTFRSRLNMAHVEIGDAIVIEHALLPDPLFPMSCEIHSVTYLMDSQQIQVRCRELKRLGHLETWDYFNNYAEPSQFFEPWDLSIAYTETPFFEDWDESGATPIRTGRYRQNRQLRPPRPPIQPRIGRRR